MFTQKRPVSQIANQIYGDAKKCHLHKFIYIYKIWGAIVVNFKNSAPRASLSPIAYYCLNYLAGCIFQPELQLTFKLFSIGPPLQTCGIFYILIFNIQYFGILLSFDKCSSFDISLSLLAAFSTSADHQDNNWVREIELDNSIDFLCVNFNKIGVIIHTRHSCAKTWPLSMNQNIHI